MDKITLQEIEMLGSLLQRAGLNYFEATWVNAILTKLKQQVPAEEPGPPED